MGIVKVKAVIANPLNQARKKEVELSVDTTIIFSRFPESILKSLGVLGRRERKFRAN